ncbi:MAG: hypothetical protein MI924_15530 [Chloroflexales bacterium]|nr:hypothetical protein [Chloroflexales bacterium]
MLHINRIWRVGTLCVALAILAACNGLSSSPNAAPTSVSGSAETPPALLYLKDGGWYERVDGSTTRRISQHPVGTAPASGTVIASTVVDDTLVVLYSLGRIEQIALTDGAELSAVGFAEPALSAQLTVLPDNARMIYTALIDDPNAQFGQGTLIGIYDLASNMVQAFSPFDQSILLIGVSVDGNNLYLLPRGQDPAYGTVQVFGIASGQIEGEIEVRGYGAPHLAPNGQRLVTVDEAGVASLYDLAAASPAPQQIPTPDPSGHVCQSDWSADSRSIYLTVCAGNLARMTGTLSSSTGLWRFDVETAELTRISAGVQDQQPFVTSNGTQLLFWHSGTQEANLIDMAAGSIQSVSLPAEMTPTEPTAYPPVASLSPNGRWLFVWDSREEMADLVDLAIGTHDRFALESNPGQPIIWR